MKTFSVGYCRCSLEREGTFGIDIQRDAILRFAKEHNQEMLEIFAEEGVSGAEASRMAWDELNAFIDQNKYIVKTVVILRLDRLARDLLIQENFIALLQRKGVELVSIEEPDLCSNDPSRKLFRQIRGAISEFERELITRRLQAGRMRKAATGRYAGGNVPYGYQLKGGELIVHTEQAQVVKRIFQMRRKPKYGRRLSFQRIAQKLNILNIPSPAGKEWLDCTVHYIFTNKSYRGLYQYGDSRKDVSSLRII